jgi:hypothetical protein
MTVRVEKYTSEELTDDLRASVIEVCVAAHDEE